MDSLFQHHPKRSSRRALSTLLLALPLSGIASQLPSAQAQPALTQPAKKSPLSSEEKATIAKVIAISHQENVCKNRLNLKMDNATLEDVVARVKELLPGQTIAVEVRGASPVHVGFNLKGARVGDVLDHVAALAGCKLFVLSNGLLIAPASLLTGAELQDIKQRQGGEWAKSTESGGSSWSTKSGASSLFTRAVAQEATGSNTTPLPTGVLKTTFGNFSPEAQAMLQEMASWVSEATHPLNPNAASLHLNAGSPISVDTSDPNVIHITFDHGISDPTDAPTLSVTDVHVPWRPNQ